MVEIDFDKGIIKDITLNKEFKTNPFPDFIQKLISSGGYVNYVKSEVLKGDK